MLGNMYSIASMYVGIDIYIFGLGGIYNLYHGKIFRIYILLCMYVDIFTKQSRAYST